MRKILFSLILITLASTTAVGATRAYFTDSTNVDNNTLATGTLNLTTNPTSQAISFTNIAPGWNYHDSSHWGYDYPSAVYVKNDGSLPLKYRMKAVITGGNYDDNLLDTMLAQVAVDTGTSTGIVSIFNGHLRDLLNWHTLDTNFTPTGHNGWWGIGEQVRIYTAIPTNAANNIQGQSIQFSLQFDSTQTTNPDWN